MDRPDKLGHLHVKHSFTITTLHIYIGRHVLLDFQEQLFQLILWIRLKMAFAKDDLAVIVTCFTGKGWTGTLNPALILITLLYNAVRKFGTSLRHPVLEAVMLTRTGLTRTRTRTRYTRARTRTMT